MASMWHRININRWTLGILALTFAFMINGCAGLIKSSVSPAAPGHLDSDSVVRVQQILWSSSGTIAIMRYPYVGEDGSVTLIFADTKKEQFLTGAYRQAEWSPDGTNLLLMKDLKFPDGSIQVNASVNNIRTGKTQLVAFPPEQIIQYCWVDNDSIVVGVGNPKPPFTKQLIVRTIDGRTLSSIDLSTGAALAIPFRLVCDTNTKNLIANIVYMNPGSRSRSWAYIIQGSSLTPVAGSLGCTREICLNPVKPEAFAVVLTGKRSETSIIAAINIRSPFPVATPLLDLSEHHLPGMSRARITQLQCSPDGGSLLMTLVPTEGPSAIMTYNLATGKLSKVADGSFATFSPDGQKIAYAAEYSVKDQSLLVLGKRVDQKGLYLPDNRIYECNSDGSQCKVIDDPPLLSAPTDAAPPGIWPSAFTVLAILAGIASALYGASHWRKTKKV